MPNITSGKRKLGPIPPEGLADLQRYLNETLAEVDIASNDGKIISAPQPSVTTLYRMTHLGKPGSIYDGRGWNDLFSETPDDSEFVWLDIYDVRDLAKDFALNAGYMFRLWFCQPGLLHVEVNDDGTWTAGEIFSLPWWMRLG